MTNDIVCELSDSDAASALTNRAAREIERLREDLSEAYQVIGALSAAWMDEDDAHIAQNDFERALDNILAAINGEPRPHDDLLPWPAKQGD